MKRSIRKQLPKRITYGVILSICLAGLGYASFEAMSTRAPDALGCFDGLEQTQTIVWVDASAPRWNEAQFRSLRRYFDQLYLNLGFNERLSVYSSEGDRVSSILQPGFSVCGQASRPEQLEAINAQGGQPGYLKKQRQRLYDNVLAPEVDALLAIEPDEARRQLYQSPILEQLAGLSRQGRLKPGTRLIIISDLIQNSESGQFCRSQNHMPRFAAFEQRRIYQQRLKPESLEGVEVEVLMIQRQGYGRAGLRYCRDEEEIKGFWRDYFKVNGVEELRFTRIRQGVVAG
ncbi:MAG: hypothetical protein KZQ96_21005 [Candidatus Thiodiazotropha sp. (ex Lucinoma borealis)]|nr:hypothetical protein [Candidatus Thiodiazotropha sp. (ex Lucinoma borealis)]